jgi:hypothetical protein
MSQSAQSELAALLNRFSTRTFRVVGAAVILFGVPSVFIFWADQGAVWGLFILIAHMYMGAFIAFGLPWLKRRQANPSVT